MNTEGSTEDILKKLQKEKKREKIKKGLSIGIILIIIAIVVFLTIFYLSYRYWKSSEVQLKLGAEIENISFSKNMETAFIKLKAGSNLYNITKVKFNFLDNQDRTYNFETTEGISEIEIPYTKTIFDYILGIFGKKPDYLGVYNYDISSDDLGIENFENINEVSVSFEYETETGVTIETPVLDTEKPKPITTTGGGGGGGGGGTTTQPTPTCTPETKETTCGSWICGVKKNNCNEDVNCGSCNSGYECQDGKCILQTTGLYEGLVAYWRFEDETSGVTPDETGINPGNLINNANIISDAEKGNILSLNGDNDYVDAGNDSSLNLQGSLTLMAWIKPKEWGEGNVGRIISKGNDSTGFSFGIAKSWCGYQNVSIYVIFGGYLEPSDPNLINLNEWQHVALIYDKNNITFFINGVKNKTLIYNNTNYQACNGSIVPAGIYKSGDPLDSSPYNLTLGIRHDMNRDFNGSMDEVMIYNRALNESEILEIYDSQKPKVTGNVYYLDAVNGNDSNPGTSSQPWKTLNRAYTWYSGEGTKVREGDTVLFRNGSYGTFSEDSHIGASQHFHRTNWVTYKADTGHTPDLNNIFVYNFHPGIPIPDPGESYLKFEGFNIKGIDDPDLPTVNLWYASYIQIIDCNVTQFSVSYRGYGAPYYDPHAFAIYGRDVNHLTIQGCQISNANYGIQIVSSVSYPSPNTSKNITVKNNTVHHIGGDGIAIVADNIDVENNYIYDINTIRVPVNIYGTITGTFTLGDEVVMLVSGEPNAEGIVHGYIEGGIDVWQTSSAPFTVSEGRPRGPIITGPNGTLSIPNLPTKVDEAHADGFVFMYSNHIVLKNNIVNRLMPGDEGTGSAWGIKSDSPTNLTIENNLIIGASVVISGTDNLNLINNTIYTTQAQRGILVYTLDTGKRNSIINNMYNNIISGMLVSADGALYYSKFVNHGNNIFGVEPSVGFPAVYPFTVNSSSELVNINVTKLFVDFNNSDFRPLMSSPACDGSVNGKAEVAVGALPCVCRNNSGCIFGGNCVGGKCIGTKTCLGINTSCGSFPDCNNCNSQNGCYGTSYRDYFCSGASCLFSSKDCTTCSCSCGGYGEAELIENNNCNDRIDNDCNGAIDSSDTGCQIPTEIPRDYVSYWKFEGNANDEKGINNGTLIDNAQIINDAGRNVLSLDGDNDSVQITKNPTLEPLSQITVSAWVKVAGNGGAPGMVVNHQHGADGYRIGYYSSGYFVFFTGVTSDWSEASTSGTTVNLNAWYHIVGVYNGDNARIFLNGVEKKPGSTQSGNIIYQDLPLYFGRAYNSGYDFNGSIDDIIIYNRSLSTLEIQRIYCDQGGDVDTCAGWFPTLSPFTRLWNFLKSILTGKTGNAILTGKITGNAAGDGSGKADYEKTLIVLVVAVLVITLIIIFIKSRKIKKRKR